MKINAYSTIKKAKDGTPVPVFFNGKPSASLYNPQREAEIFAQQTIFCESHFFVIGGIGAALHLYALQENYPQAIIIAVEKNDESIAFLREHIEIPQTVHLCTFEKLAKKILELYYPPIHGNFVFEGLRSWKDAHTKDAFRIKEIISSTLKNIAQDISTQSHFGMIWHRNILLNLQLITEIPDKCYGIPQKIQKKDALIFAAGPSLDKYLNAHTVYDIKKNYVIAVDTAYKVLLEKNIEADALITVDAQAISLLHFSKGIAKKTLYISDISGSPQAARIAKDAGCSVFFFNGGHPLSQLITSFCQRNYGKTLLPSMSAGSGSVSIAALDYAQKMGFLTIKTAGLDFAYPYSKPYAKGTYLDEIYHKTSHRLYPIEQSFCSLMFRTPLEKTRVCIKTKNGRTNISAKTSPIMKSYQESYDMKKKETPPNNILKTSSFNRDFAIQDFFSWYKKEIRELLISSQKNIKIPVIQSILPFAAALSKKKLNSQLDLTETLNRVLTKTVQLTGEFNED